MDLDLKCIVCLHLKKKATPAEYLVEGNSMCSKHARIALAKALENFPREDS